MTKLARLSLLIVLLLGSTSAWAQFDHARWDSLLQKHVVVFGEGEATAVNYDAFQADRAQLQAYLNELSAVSKENFESWPLNEQLAFLINVYNAWTVELILSEFPDIDSIRDIGFLPGAAWRRDIVALFGEQVSLDDVEHGMIRGWDRYKEPRIHFAVNCAAIGCPALRAEAYTGADLDEQLKENTRLFLADRSRNYLDGNTLYISRIFDWYKEDFEQGWGGVDSVAEFLVQFSDALGLSTAQSQALLDGDIRIRHLRYDWGLNKHES